MASTTPFYLDCPFKGEYVELSKGIGITATVSGIVIDLPYKFSDFKFVSFMAIDNGSDGKSHRMIQTFNSEWLVSEIIAESNANVRKICFNYYRNDKDMRCWVTFHYNNESRITFNKTSDFTNRVDLVISGWI